MRNHPYLSLQTVDTISLDILYGESSGTFSKTGITLNTRDPSKFEQLYAEASRRMMKDGEAMLENELESLVGRHSSAIKDEAMLLENNAEN